MLVLVRGAVLSGIALLIAICSVSASALPDGQFAALRVATRFDAAPTSDPAPTLVRTDDAQSAGARVVDPARWGRADASSAPQRPVIPDVPLVSTGLQEHQAQAALPPARIVIEKVGIDMAIEPVGVLGDGAMQIPADVSIAGWYRWGADLASTSGTIVIAAHVDSLEFGLGPFARLVQLDQGSSVTLVDAGGQPHRYVLSGESSIAKSDLPVQEIFSREGSPRLVLITCGGTFDRRTLTYSDNVVFRADPAAAGGSAQ